MAVPVAIEATADPLIAARRLAPQLSERALEGERAATLPADLVAQARQAGLFGLAAPRDFGGLELPPATILRVGEELSKADGSAGWTIMLGNLSFVFAWLEPSVAAELLDGVTDSVSAGVFAPTGQLLESGGGFELSGRWSFCSGCLHANWLINGAVVSDGERPRMRQDWDMPDWRLVITEMSNGTVADNWDVAGLRGTGSHDVTIAGLAVPAEHTIAPFFELARHDGPLWRLPFYTLLGSILAGIPLGIARRMLDELTELAPAKTRLPNQFPLSHDEDLQVALTRAEGMLHAARAFVFEEAWRLWDIALAGDLPEVPARARFLLATQQCMRAAVEAVDIAFGFAGSSSLRSTSAMQRCFRDIHAASQHLYFSPVASKRYAKTRFGIEQPTFWF